MLEHIAAVLTIVGSTLAICVAIQQLGFLRRRE